MFVNFFTRLRFAAGKCTGWLQAKITRKVYGHIWPDDSRVISSLVYAPTELAAGAQVPRQPCPRVDLDDTGHPLAGN